MPDILLTMAGNLFDVFVVGATDSSAAGEARLASALSTKHGVPLATVAKAISAKNLRAGQSLEQPQAQALVRQLQSIGAVTVIRPAAARTQSHSAVPSQVSQMPSTSAPLPGDPSLFSTQLGMPAASGFGMPSVAPTSSNDPFSPVTPGVASVSARSMPSSQFMPRHVPTPSIAITTPRPRQKTSTPSGRGQARVAATGLALDVAAMQSSKLQLARDDHSESAEDMAAARSRGAPLAGSLREMGMGGSSGVAMDEDPRNLNLVKCVQHGLYYDKSKASGCRKCMSPAREVANRIEARTGTFHVGNLRGKPAKRAFLGLTFALVLGLLPAVYYCFGPGSSEVGRLRVEQELLSRQPGTEDAIRQFDELDVRVSDAHGQATRNTAIVWLAVTSVAMLGWYKIT